MRGPGGWHSDGSTANHTSPVDEGRRVGPDLPSLVAMPDLLDRVRSLRPGARRAVLRRRRSLSALCAAGAVFTGLQVVAPPEAATVAVLAAARDLPSGRVLGADDVRTIRLPPDTAPEGHQPASRVLGRTLASPMRRGEVLTDARLVQGSLLAGYPGLVAVPVRIPDAGSVALLEVGDRVDVLAADPRGDTPAEVTLARAPVLALPQPDPGTAAGTGASGALVVLGASAAAARRLAGRAVADYLSVTISR